MSRAAATFHRGVVIDHIEVNKALRHHDQYPDSQIVGKSMDSVDIVTDDETIKRPLIKLCNIKTKYTFYIYKLFAF